jgi:hypothetical protein
VIGGLNRFGVATTAFEAFACDSKSWRMLPELTRPVTQVSAAKLLNTDTILFTDFSSRCLHTYNTATQEFTRVPINGSAER